MKEILLSQGITKNFIGSLVSLEWQIGIQHEADLFTVEDIHATHKIVTAQDRSARFADSSARGAELDNPSSIYQSESVVAGATNDTE